MKILNQSDENLSKEIIYRLTKSPNVRKMSEDGIEVEKIKVSAWIEFEEPDFKDPEKISHVLSIYDETTGESYATNSPTFNRSFFEIVDIFGNTGYDIGVVQGTSKAGRTFIQAVYI